MELIILDRDGVINEVIGEGINSPEDFVPLQGSLEAIARLNHAGYTVILVTCQRGIGQSHLDLDSLHSIHDKLRRLLTGVGGTLDGIFFCPHGSDENACDCYLPEMSLYREIRSRLGQSLAGVPIVSSDRRNWDCALALQAKPVLLKTGRGMETLSQFTALSADNVFADLAAYVDYLLENEDVTQC